MGEIAMDYKTDTRQRDVSVPMGIAQPVHWADRHANKRSASTERRTKGRSVKRTLAQTGVPATEGRVRYVRAMPRQAAHAAQIPARSARQKARSGSFVRRMLTMVAL